MAYQTRHRDPLLESHIQEMIQRRGSELAGLILLGLSVALGAIIFSYVPDDPGWLASTSEPARNWLGRTGATIASPLHVTIGYGGWGIVLLGLIWGFRLVAHEGKDRFLQRIIFAPIAVAVGAIFASSHVPPEGWAHSFGVGGLFGDTVLGAGLTMLPLDGPSALNIISVACGLLLVAMVLHAGGFVRAEITNFLRFMLYGVILTYAGIARTVGYVTHGSANVAQAAARRAPAAPAAVPPAAAPAPAADEIAEPAKERRRVPILAARRDPAPAKPAEEAAEPAPPATPDRIRTRIADAIRLRADGGRPAPLVPPAPPMHSTAAGDGVLADAPDDEAEPLPTLILTRRAPPPLTATPAKARVVPGAARPAPSRQAREEVQPRFRFEEKPVPNFEPPPLTLLTSPREVTRHTLSESALEENARMLESVLDDYGVKGDIVSVRPGPVVTMYELEPAPGLKASRVIGLADDIARSMSALSARVSTLPGRSVIGIELPNAQREKVVLREILSAREYGDANMRLPLALGKDIGGEPVVTNLAKMPHLLIAGTTGSGKSVAINTMILSLLYRLSPEQCRMIMIDPKMLELSVYDGIPHLLSPVVTDPKKAVVALKWVVGEMEERYRKMSKMGVRNIEGYNARVLHALDKGEMFSRTVQTGFDDVTGDPIFETEEFAPESLPYIVVVVDEMADLMMVAGKEIEACIQRLAQMARASGIHLIMATQRPSVDVITGTIKANFPTRISFQVTSKIDSRTILGEQGAEQLLGMGDMLYMAGGGKISRIHGPFVSDEEVEEVVTHLKSYGPPEYVTSVVEGPDDDDAASDIDMVLGLGGNTDSEDAQYDQAVAIVLKDRKCSTSYVQRKLGIGYNKAARLVEKMEEEGVVSPANHVGKRDILVPER